MTVCREYTRFAVVPEWLLDAGVSGQALKLYCWLAVKYGTRTKDGRECVGIHPSVDTIAAGMGTSRMTVKRQLAELIKVGALAKALRQTDRRRSDTSSYRLMVGSKMSLRGTKNEPPLTCEFSGEGTKNEPLQGTKNEPQTKNQKNQRRSKDLVDAVDRPSTLFDLRDPVDQPAGNVSKLIQPGSDDDLDFVEFWANYPRKVGKPAARKAWAAARKRGADPKMIIKAAARYRDDIKRKPEFTKHPGPWLNDERYNDERHERPRWSQLPANSYMRIDMG